MKKKVGFRLIVSILSISVMFFAIYQVAFAATYGGGIFGRSDVKQTVVLDAVTSDAAITFTVESLSKFDGMNGNPAYVAVDGIVYDMTKIGSWKNGKHQGLSAGTDLSVEFGQSPHTKTILDQAVIVGRLIVPAKGSDFTITPATVTTVEEPVDAVTSASTAEKEVAPISGSAVQQKPKSSVAAFTSEWLAAFNGQNDNPAYIAVDGIIYDVSDLGAWDGGTHKGITAGKDVTSQFAGSPHSKSILDLARVVGKLQSSTAAPVVDAPAAASTTTTEPTTTTTASATWTLEALSGYNGMNGARAYIAVNGTIYDVSGIGSWSSGSHKGIKAGQDVTEAFSSSPHSASLLSQLPIVARLGDAIAENVIVTEPSASIANPPTIDVEDDDDDDHDDDDHDDDDDDHDHDNDDDDDDDDDDDHDRDDD